MGKGLGYFLDEFLKYDPKNLSIFWRNYMHIRVTLDVRKSLKRQKKCIENGELKIVGFKYERVTTFLYLCGILGHNGVNCENLFEMESDYGNRG